MAEKTSKIDEIMREAVGQLKETELAKVELSDLKTINSQLKTKLAEAQEALKSNDNLITYLNKQLNEKPGGLGGANAGFSSTLSKPPTGGFKPSFSSIDSLSKTI